MKIKDCMWFRKEHELEVRDDVSFNAFSADGEVGIMLAPDEDDLDLKVEEAAFLFGDGSNDLWFRPTLGSFFKVSLNPDEAAVAAKLYHQPCGTYRNCSLVNDVRICVPVYHDALSMIPIKDTREEDFEEDDASAPMHLAQDDDALEETVVKHLESTEQHYTDIMEAIDREVNNNEGRLIVRYRPGASRLYSYDVIELKQRLIILTYGEFNGDWLAEEASFHGEDPLWFSETDHRVSPVFQSRKCRDFYRQKCPDLTFCSAVVVPAGCTIINTEEMEKIWRDDCATPVLGTTPDGAPLQTLHDYFMSMTTLPDLPQYDNHDIIFFSNAFAMNPRNWTHA